MLQQNRTLYIFAAGQPDTTAPILNELKRPLSRKGIANVLGFLEELKENAFQSPELILYSPSLYVRQTLDLLHEILGATDAICKDNLYAAPDYRILETVQALDDIFFSVLILGELPGLNQFISYVAQNKHPGLLKPADGLCLQLSKDMSWRDLDKQTAKSHPLFCQN